MEATPQDLEALFEIQSVDLEIVKMNKELDELPQRAIILNCRQKRDEISDKLKKVTALKKEATKKLTKIDDEDSSLIKKEKGVQAAIEAAGNDFRSAEARTKELDGIFRRRNTLSENRESVKEELTKIATLEGQITRALSDLDAKEDEATKSFKEQGGSLQQAIAIARAKHEMLLDAVTPEVANLYEFTSKLFDTIFIGYLEGNQCSVCRAKIEAGRLLDLKNSGPLTSCPSCKRIMIVKD